MTKAEERAFKLLEQQWDKLKPEDMHSMDRMIDSAGVEAREGVAPPVKFYKAKSFWHEEEDDNDLITDEQNEEFSEEDDIMGMAHDKFEEYREYREYARLAAWEMPLLSSE